MPMITWLFRKLMYKSVPDLQGLQHPLNTDFLPQRLFRMLITCPFQKINGQIAPGLYLISFRKLQVFFFLEKNQSFYFLILIKIQFFNTGPFQQALLYKCLVEKEVGIAGRVRGEGRGGRWVESRRKSRKSYFCAVELMSHSSLINRFNREIRIF